MDYDAAAKIMQWALTADDLFPEDDDSKAQRGYRELAQALHPDRNPDEPEAEMLFARLSSIWSERKRSNDPASPLLVSTRRNTYLMDRKPAFRGDLANHYRARYNVDGEEKTVLLKMPREPRNSDLMQAEGFALRQIWVQGDERFRAYIPQHLESFRQRDNSDHKERLTNALIFPPGLFSLAEVRSAYPRGVHPKDIAWMWRRIFVVLGYFHQVGLVHGAIVPEHVLISPENHGLILIDWCYATDIDESIKVIVTGPSRKFYPQEVLDKKPANESTDIYMATKCMMYLFGDDTPKQFRAFAKGSTSPRPESRPTDAWLLKEEYEELLEELWGERRFHPFTMPARA